MRHHDNLHHRSDHKRSDFGDDETDLFVAGLKHLLKLRKKDSRGLLGSRRPLRWQAERNEESPADLFELFDRRTRLMEDPKSRVYQLQLSSDQISPKMLALIESVDHKVPILDAHATWVRTGRYSDPKLYYSVRLHDPDNAPNLLTVMSFSSDLEPGSDLSKLSPVELDPHMILAERWGWNLEAAQYSIVPHEIERMPHQQAS